MSYVVKVSGIGWAPLSASVHSMESRQRQALRESIHLCRVASQSCWCPDISSDASGTFVSHLGKTPKQHCTLVVSFMPVRAFRLGGAMQNRPPAGARGMEARTPSRRHGRPTSLASDQG